MLEAIAHFLEMVSAYLHFKESRNESASWSLLHLSRFLFVAFVAVSAISILVYIVAGRE
jgi:hypothetical protein